MSRSTVRLRHVAEVNPPTWQFDVLSDDAVVTFMPLETVWADDRLDTSRVRVKSDVSTGYVRFQDDDVLCPKVTPTFQAGRSALVSGLAGGVGAATTEVHVVRARKELSDARYLRYVLLTKHFLEEGVARFQGVAGLQRVPDEFLRDLPVAANGLAEQRRIAEFLDDQVTRIDNIITARRQQILLVAEQVDAELESILAHRVTRPLDTLTDPCRPIQYGIVLPGPDYPEGIPIVKGGDVAGGHIRFDMLKRTDPAIEARYPRSRLISGDLVMSIRGSVGEVASVPDELTGANLTQDTARIAPLRADPEWLRWVLRTPGVQAEIRRRVTGAMVPGINIEALRDVRVPEVPRGAQAVLGRRAARVAALAEARKGAMSRSVELLQEFKRSLISAAVSGEFDVSTASGRGVPA